MFLFFSLFQANVPVLLSVTGQRSSSSVCFRLMFQFLCIFQAMDPEQPEMEPQLASHSSDSKPFSSSSTDGNSARSVPIPSSSSNAPNVPAGNVGPQPQVKLVLDGSGTSGSTSPEERVEGQHLPDKRFMKIHASYFKAFGPKTGEDVTADRHGRPAAAGDVGIPVDKKFMRGVDAYLRAGKRDGEKGYPPAEKKFMKGVDAYLSTGKREGEQEPPSAEKKFLKGVNAYLQAGKRKSHPQSPSAEKKFMRGVDAYLSAGKRNDEQELSSEGSPTNEQVAGAAEKKFMRGVDAYIMAGKREDPLSPAELGSPVEKKFIRGFEAYLRTGTGNAQGQYPGPSMDKKFLRGIDAYLQGMKDPSHAVPEPDKKFMRGVDAYIQTGKKDDSEFSVPPEKKFLRGVDAYMQAGKKDTSETVESMEKNFVPAVDAYIKPGLEKTPSTDEEQLFLADKRFMRGIEMYLNRNQPQKDKREDKNRYVFEDDPMDSEDVDTVNAGEDKRFMRGVELYINRPSERREHVTNVGSDQVATAEENRFMRGVFAYHDKSSGDSQPSERGSDDGTADGKSRNSDKAKRFLKGVNPYLRQAQGKRDEGGSDGTQTEDELELQMIPSQKRFLKGVNLYLQHHSSGDPASQRQHRVKRSGDTASERTEKRFLKGINPYLQRYASGGPTEKRFMKIPYLMGDPTPVSGSQTDEVKRSDSSEDEVVFDDNGEETVLTDKRFLKGMNGYLRGFVTGKATKRFMKGVNPYLQAFFSRMGTDRINSQIRGKRFMKGINPYLKAYSQAMGNEKMNTYELGERAYGAKRGKRFLKGVNPYLQLYSNRWQNKRFGTDEDSVGRPAQKRFMKGVDQYLLQYANRPQFKRVLGDENEEDVVSEINGENTAVEKRFMKGINPYLQQYFKTQQLKRQYEILPEFEKRFLKGVDHYLRVYSNRPRIRRDAEESPEKRFIKNFEFYLQRHQADKPDSTRPELLVSLGKRFVRGINPYLQNYVSALRDKRFLRGVNLYLQNYNNNHRNDVEKRFMRGIDYYLDNQPTDKRFLKGVDPYLQSYARQQGKRDDKEDSDSAKDQKQSDKSNIDEVPATASQSSTVREKKFLKGANRYLLQHLKPRSKRQTPGVNFFGLSQSHPVFQTFKTDGQPAPPKEKRFMKGANPYLRAFSNAPRPSRKEYDDMQNYIGDTLVTELAKTARVTEDKQRHDSQGRADFRFDQDEAYAPEVPELQPTAPRWKAETVYRPFPRQPLYSPRLGGSSFGQIKRVFKYPRGNGVPTYGARQFMIWNNGEYRLG